MLLSLLFFTLTVGSASARSTVTTHIEGSGSVYNRIDIQANDQHRVFESDQPGTYTLSVTASSSAAPTSPLHISIFNQLINFFNRLLDKIRKLS